MIVTDTGPLIAFPRIRGLSLLQQVVRELVIPEAVYNELVGTGRDRPGAQEVEHSMWIQRRAVTDLATLALLPAYLHRGEREALVLARELRVRLLIDEQRGRKVAVEWGVEVLGSLGVLAEAKRSGFVERVKPLVDALLAAQYWIEEDLVQPFLQELGEDDA